MYVDKQFIVDIVTSPIAAGLSALVLAYVSYRFGLRTQQRAHVHESGMASEAREQERQQRIRDGYADVCAKGAEILSINTEIRLGAWQDPDRLDPLRCKAKIALGGLRAAVSVVNILDSDKERYAHADTMYKHANSFVVLVSSVANPHADATQGKIHADAVNGIQEQMDAIGGLFV